MTDPATASHPSTVWIIGPAETSPTPDTGATPGEDHARWVQLTDEQDFRGFAEGISPTLSAIMANARLRSTGKRRPLADVRRLAQDWLLVMAPTIWYTEIDRQVHTGTFACLLGPDTVVTLETGGALVCENALDRLRAVGVLHGTGVRRVTVAILLALLSSASDVEVALGDAVAETERLVFARAVSDPVARIYKLKREITEARRALLPLTAELPELVSPGEERRSALIEKRMLERLMSTIERIDRHLDAHDSLLSDMLQVHLAQVSVRQNEDMRKISAWAAILVYPTIVAGIYGMNFRHIPELDWWVGYPFALGLIVAGCVVLFQVFKKAGWM